MITNHLGAALLVAQFGDLWAIAPSAFEAYAVATGHASGDRAERTRSSSARPTRRGTIAVIPIQGFLTPKPLPGWLGDLVGGTDMQTLTQRIRDALGNQAIARIVLDVDSPGGVVGGIPETAAVIREAARSKPVDAAVSSAGSAAYWLASQAGRLSVTPSGEVGSIGVFAVHTDWSEADAQAGIRTTYIPAKASPFKVELAPVPLAKEARQDLQRRVDARMTTFVADVARGRRTSEARVKASYGKGRMVLATDAKAAGMVDEVATLDEALRQAVASRSSQSRASSTGSRRNSILADSLIEDMS